MRPAIANTQQNLRVKNIICLLMIVPKPRVVKQNPPPGTPDAPGLRKLKNVIGTDSDKVSPPEIVNLFLGLF